MSGAADSCGRSERSGRAPALCLFSEAFLKADIAARPWDPHTTVIKAGITGATEVHVDGASTSCAPLEPAARQSLATTPNMLAKVIAEPPGWTGWPGVCSHHDGRGLDHRAAKATLRTRSQTDHHHRSIGLRIVWPNATALKG